MNAIANMPKYILSDDIDRQDRKQGFVTELIDMQHESDGGPVAIGWFRDRAEAEKVLHALRLPARF